MNKYILATLSCAVVLLPSIAYAEFEPTNVHTTVNGNTVRLIWDAPATIREYHNAYAILMQKDIPITDTNTYNNSLYPSYALVGTTQYTFSDLTEGTYYFRVGIGTCTPQNPVYCIWSAYNDWSTVVNAQVSASTGASTPFPACANPPAHSLDCVDKLENGILEARHNFSCQTGYTKQGGECVSNSSNKAPTDGTLTCELPLISFGGKCVYDVNACINPPAHSNNCVDLIKDGQLQERHMFMCDAGYTKQGTECVSGATTEDTTVTPSDSEVIDEQEISEDQPDLTITVGKGILTQRTFKGGAKKKQYKISVTIFNKGAGDTDDDIYFSASIKTKITPILVTKSVIKAGKSKQVFYYIDATEKGKKYLFTVDADNKISESNETNNQASRIIGK